MVGYMDLSAIFCLLSAPRIAKHWQALASIVNTGFCLRCVVRAAKNVLANEAAADMFEQNLKPVIS